MSNQENQVPETEKKTDASLHSETVNNAEDAVKTVDSANQDNQNTENAEEMNHSEVSSDSETSDSAKNVEVSETDALKAELSAANDRNLRLMAEFENYRRRSAKELLDTVEVANGKLLEKLSEVLDNFERAFAAENKAKDLESFEQGVRLIHNQFAKILKDAGLEQLDPLNQPFDPNYHEALMQQPSETVAEGNVITVFQKGYKLKNKLLKTAKVIVSSGK